MTEQQRSPAPDGGPKLVPFPALKSEQSGGQPVRNYRLIGALAIVLLLLIGGIWWLLTPSGSVHYTTTAVTRGAITRSVTATGTVNPELTIIVGTYVSGVIQELYCDYNTVVKKGQICAKIDPRPYQTAVDQAKANLAVAKAQHEKDRALLAYTKITYERAARLVQTNAVSQDAADSAKSNYEQAEAQVVFDQATIDQRQAALDAAQVNLDYTNIISPVDGVVVSRAVTMGQTVAASFQTPTLFLIATDLTKMEVDTNVSEGDIGGVKVGNASTFTVDAFSKRVFKGTVTQVRQSPQTVQNVVTYDVIVGVENADLLLKPGMTAATRIVVDQRNDVIRVPNAALRYWPSDVLKTGPLDHAQVWVLRNGRPVGVPVVIGLDDEASTEIVSGNIVAEDRVITAEQSSSGSRSTAPRLRF